MLKLKAVREPALADEVKVSVAETEVFGVSTEPALFQVTMRKEFAFEGTQADVIMLSVTGTVPAFFI